MQIINEKLRQALLSAALMFVVITIPLYNNLNSIAIVIFVISCFIQRPVKESLRVLGTSKLWWFPAVYFVWLSLSYFWDITGGYIVKDIERYAALFFLPPFLALIPKFSFRQIRNVCYAFAASTVVICLICLFKSYREYNVTHDYRVFYYHYLGMQMGLNAIFLSCYCMVSITWLLYYCFVLKENNSGGKIMMKTSVSIFLFGMIFLLSSKLMIFLTLLTLVFYILYIGKLKRRLGMSVLITVAMLGAGMYAIMKLSYLNYRVNVTEVRSYRGQEDDQNGIAIRMLMWETAWDMFRERPLLGYGIHGARNTVLEKFKERNFMLGYSQGYHSHNQYLESAIMGGVFALFLFLAMIVSTLREGWRARNFLLLHLLFVLMVQSLVESVFEVQQELVFYIFFIFLFVYHPVKRVKNHPDHAGNAML